MPIAKLDGFRQDVRQFLTVGAQIEASFFAEYITNKAPEIAAIWPKVVENNEKLFRGEVAPMDLWGVMTLDEMLSLAGMFRHVYHQLAALRMAQNPLAQGVRIESADADGVKAEWQIVPGASEGKVLLYFHGGGFIAWSAYTHRPLTVALGQATRMSVLSVDYRLAPENPFPAALEDCTKAYLWLLSKGFKPSDIVIGGDSAGGNLTLATLLNLRDEGVPLPKGGICISPSTNFGALPFSRMDTDAVLADMGIFWWGAAYLGVENFAQGLNPLVSPFSAISRGSRRC